MKDVERFEAALADLRDLEDELALNPDDPETQEHVAALEVLLEHYAE